MHENTPFGFVLRRFVFDYMSTIKMFPGFYRDTIYVVIFVSYIHVYFLHNSVICSNAQSNTMVLVHSEEEDAEEKEDII